jgi:hypothetical protein
MRERQVAEHHDGLRGQSAWRGCTTQQTVAAQHVATPETAVAPLPGGAVSVGGRAQVHAHRVRRQHRAPSGAAQAQGEIEVLHVGEDRFVQTSQLLPRRTAVGRRCTRRPSQDGPLAVGLRDVQSLQSREAAQRHVGGEPRAVDQPLARLQHQRRHRADPRVLLERHRQRLQKVCANVDVVVQQHNHLARAGRHATVAGFGEAVILLEALDVHIWPVRANTGAAVVDRAVVDEDDPMLDCLLAQMAQAAVGQLVPAVGDDHHVDRGRHDASSYWPAHVRPGGAGLVPASGAPRSCTSSHTRSGI